LGFGKMFSFYALRRQHLLRPKEHCAHGVCGFLLGREVQVRIDVRSRGEGAVSQPKLDLLHGDPIAEQQAGEGVPLRYNYDKPEKPCGTGALRV
jgi:hypothetical protein